MICKTIDLRSSHGLGITTKLPLQVLVLWQISWITVITDHGVSRTTVARHSISRRPKLTGPSCSNPCKVQTIQTDIRLWSVLKCGALARHLLLERAVVVRTWSHNKWSPHGIQTIASRHPSRWGTRQCSEMQREVYNEQEHFHSNKVASSQLAW